MQVTRLINGENVTITITPDELFSEYNGPVEPVDRTTLSQRPIHTEPSTDSD